MSKSLRSNRIPIMMTDDELASVDNFRFDHRIATRSEALRCLALLGIMQSEIEARVAAVIGRSSRGRSARRGGAK